jgi:putative transposase
MGESIVITRRHKRRRKVAELLETLMEQHPRGTVYVAWDNDSTHEDDEVEAVLRGAAGRLVLLYVPTYSRWLNPAEMLWRQLRHEVTHCELFESIDALLDATGAFFNERLCRGAEPGAVPFRCDCDRGAVAPALSPDPAGSEGDVSLPRPSLQP